MWGFCFSFKKIAETSPNFVNISTFHTSLPQDIPVIFEMKPFKVLYILGKLMTSIVWWYNLKNWANCNF